MLSIKVCLANRQHNERSGIIQVKALPVGGFKAATASNHRYHLPSHKRLLQHHLFMFVIPDWHKNLGGLLLIFVPSAISAKCFTDFLNRSSVLATISISEFPSLFITIGQYPIRTYPKKLILQIDYQSQL